jgi:hypothetical protein
MSWWPKSHQKGIKSRVTAKEGSGFGRFLSREIALEYRSRLEPENRDSLAAGDRHHARKTLAERVAGAVEKTVEFPIA